MGGETPAAARPEVDAFDLAGTGMLVADASGLILRANRTYCELVGRREPELIGQPFVHAFPKPAQPLVRRTLKAALGPDALPMPSHWTLLRRDGRSVAVLLTVRAAGGDERPLAVITVTDVTALAATEARLTAVLEEQRLILDHAQVGVLFSRSGRIMRANAACGRMFGYPERELVGLPTTALVPAIDGTEPAGDEPWHAELEARHRDATAFWCEIDGQPFSAPGEPVQSIWTLRDVTERRRAQEELARVLLDQRAILDNASVGIVFTRDREVQRCNRKAEELFGYGPGELIGRSGDIFYPDEAAYAALGRQAGPVLARGEAFQAELQMKRKDGALFWCRMSAKAVNPHAPHQETIWIGEDITESRRAAESLARLLRELSTIFDTATVGIVYSRNRVVQRCNRRLEELFGYAPGELIGRSTAVLFPDEPAFERFGAEAFAAIERGETYEAEVPHLRKDGTTILCRLSGRAIDPHELSQGLIWTIQDVTAQHAAQEALRRARDELERRVAERTGALAEKNAELETEIAERRHAEELLRVRGERLLYHRNQLMALARRDRADLGESLAEILAVACTTLRLDRASYWRMLPEGRGVRCELAHRADGGADPAPAADTVGPGEHPAYFSAIVANEIIAAEDAESHPATRSLGPDYLRPLGITAMLAAPVWLDGHVVGLACCEVTRGTRAWQPEEVDFASGIATMIALAIEASQRVDAEGKLLRLAHYDALTELPNRNLLADRLRQALVFASRHRMRVALMFLDLDRFKNINDSLGHHVGDQILKEVAARLTRALRAGDTVARLGGDEFVIVLQEVRNAHDAAMVAQNLLRDLAPPYLVEGRELHVSASIGITLYPDDGRDGDVLMQNADVAMYHVKDGGRNGYQFFASTMNQQANRRLEIEHDLRLAIRRGELVLHYQPQIDLARREVRAVEALVRWRHPEHGLLLPDEFVGIAEESGLGRSLGEWTLREACSQSRRWQAAGLRPVPVAVNLSARVFRDQTLPATLAGILRDTALAPQFLELEITESAVMQQSDTTLETLSQLSAMGIQLSVDDFGTGYSSLAYLKRFPIDKLKIDQSFVRDVPGDGDDVAITQAIISLAKTLGLRVVAEGVETEAQLAFLVAHGCHDAQGNLFCAPCDGRETERIFAGDDRRDASRRRRSSRRR
jgi:diguanylate cyclase (GGDEF)-like protein/PAS domain S-box-containing protein